MPGSPVRSPDTNRRFELPQAAFIGYGSIDSEHQTLFAIINDMVAEFADVRVVDAAHFANRVANLRDHMAAHFEHEEADMADVRYGETEGHAAHHAAILVRLDAFHTKIRSQPTVTAEDTFELFDRLLDDVLRADLAFKDFLVAQGLAHSRI